MLVILHSASDATSTRRMERNVREGVRSHFRRSHTDRWLSSSRDSTLLDFLLVIAHSHDFGFFVLTCYEGSARQRNILGIPFDYLRAATLAGSEPFASYLRAATLAGSGPFASCHPGAIPMFIDVFLWSYRTLATQCRRLHLVRRYTRALDFVTLRFLTRGNWSRDRSCYLEPCVRASSRKIAQRPRRGKPGFSMSPFASSAFSHRSNS